MGLATAQLAHSMGASITIGSNDRRHFETVAGTVPDARLIEIDITQRQSVEAAFMHLPALDHLVITAGRRINGKVSDSDPDYLFQAVQERVAGAIYAIRAALPLLAKDASITLTSGLLAQRPLMPGNAVFAASVGGIDALVRGLALELAPVRVNAVAPGPTDSPLFAYLEPQIRKEHLERSAARTCVKRVGQVEDMASAFVFMMCNHYISGEILNIDGGARVT